MKELEKYAHADNRIAGWQLVSTLGLLTAVFLLLCQFWRAGSYLAALPFLLVCSVLNVRLFVLQHDCGHATFFSNRRLNNGVGFFLAVFTLTPILNWRYSHNLHHATSGKLDDRGFGDIWMMTCAEYQTAAFRTRILYRLYRFPPILFCLGPFFYFVVRRRFPIHITPTMSREHADLKRTNLLLLVAYGGLVYLAGLWVIPLLVLIYLPGAALGTWLFYAQHTFEDAYWRRQGRWDYSQAALVGSSFYDLPAFFHWCTAYIGYHHIHHLNPRIPNYRLKRCHEENRASFENIPVVRLRDTFRLMGLKLWDEGRGRYVRFSGVPWSP